MSVKMSFCNIVLQSYEIKTFRLFEFGSAQAGLKCFAKLILNLSLLIPIMFTFL